MKEIKLPESVASKIINIPGNYEGEDFIQVLVEFIILYKDNVKDYCSAFTFFDKDGGSVVTQDFDAYDKNNSKKDAHDNSFLLLDSLDYLNDNIFYGKLDTAKIVNDLRSELERKFLYNLFIYDYVFEVEGGYVNDPHDTGGETNLGISKRYHPDVDIKNLSKEQANDIYQSKYLKQAIKIFEDNKIPDVTILLVIFGFVINSGERNVVRFLDGDTQITYDEMIQKRYEYYHNLVVRKPHFGRYKKGWNNRIFRLEEWIEENAESYN